MRRCRGFTYLTALFILAFMAVGWAAAGTVWQTVSVRDKEADLLFVGNQYRLAIQRFYLAGPRRYPRTLEELLKDPRQPSTQRYLRRLYADPITGSADWGLVRAPDGGVMGVYSLSEDAPVKKSNFKVRDALFEGAAKYVDWKFVYNPSAQTGAALPKPGATPPGQTPQGQAGAPLQAPQPQAPAPAAK